MWGCSTPPRRDLIGLGLSIAFSLLSASRGSAQAIDEKLWTTNGTVNAVAHAGGTIYAGGSFTQVGPATGGGVPLDAASGLLPAFFPKVTGVVYTVIPDGAGGWYIGGQFTTVGGVSRSNIARVASDMSVSAWNPNANGIGVRVLARSGPTVYAGGYFTSIGGQARNRIAALNATSGLATAWNPSADSTVFALAVSASKIYAGGIFTTIGGQSRNRIAALDSTTGFATAWNPRANATVYAVVVSDTIVYAAGAFDSIGSQPRYDIAALGIASGQATGWNPNANNSTVFCLAVRGRTVYAGGAFLSMGGLPRNNIAAINALTGVPTAWNPNASSTVYSLAVSDPIIYAGGVFTSIDGQARGYVAALDTLNGHATAWNPNANNSVRALAVSGSTVYAGGYFSSMNVQARGNIAAFDATTGAATAWNPNAAGGAVNALAVSGSRVYAGGAFTNIGGQPRSRIAALDITTGLATAWNPNAGTTVYALAVGGSAVYAGGSFTTIGGQPRGRIAALDTAGVATGWNPNAGSTVYALVASDSIVYAGGAFTNIGVQTRNHLAALDVATGAANAWDPNADGVVRTLALSDSTMYAGGLFMNMSGESRNRIAAVSVRTGRVTGWNPDANDAVNALAVSGPTVYAGGDFVTMGVKSRNHIAALNAATGLATAWNPDAIARVRAFAISGSTVYAGGDFTTIGVSSQAYIAAIAAAPAISSILPANGGNSGPVTVTVLGSGFANGDSVRLSRAGQPDIPGTGVAVAADALSLNAIFDLTGAATGLWDVVVVGPDAQTATLPDGFTIEAVRAPQLRVDVVGPGVLRANHQTAFDLVLENRGNVDAFGVPLWIAGIPANATVELDFALAYPPRDGGEPDWTTVPLSFTSVGGRYLALVIPRIPPGTMSRRIHLTVPPIVSSFQLTAALTPPWVDGATLRNCLSDGGVIVNTSCMGTQLTAINAFLAANPQLAALSGIGVWAKIGWRCEGATSLPTALTEAEQALDYMVRPVEQLGTVAASCGAVLSPRWRDVLAVSVVSSVDPNEKLGAHGTLSGQQALPYSIRFENLSSATAPAQHVVVADALDPITLDANTVSLDAIAFGSTRIVPPPGLSSYATQVDLRPGRNLLVNVSASLDRFTGVLSWYFTSIDPVTGQPPTNPLVGFLPANLVPPEGEGSVLFTVMPRAGLATGTQIGNRAAITFDDPPAVNTPDWLNLVDNSPPSSHVLALGANQDSMSFTVRWEATGSPPDLKDFTIYAAEDGGAYRAWRLNTVATADTFVCGGRHTYSFYSVARDLSGNIEAAPGSPDAQTFARLAGAGDGGPWRLALEGAHPNPAVNGVRVWFTLPSRERAVLEVMDIAGRRVLRREVGSLGPGRHLVDLSASLRAPGLYFLRLAQGGQLLRARVAVIH
jgi:hypothetical protein